MEARHGAAVMSLRDQWHRAIPWTGNGLFRTVATPIERMVYPNQLRGTVISYAGSPPDFRVDPVREPHLRQRHLPGLGGRRCLVPSSAAEDQLHLRLGHAGGERRLVLAAA